VRAPLAKNLAAALLRRAVFDPRRGISDAENRTSCIAADGSSFSPDVQIHVVAGEILRRPSSVSSGFGGVERSGCFDFEIGSGSHA